MGRVSAMQVTPRGVQLVLGTPQQPALVDTIVMSNLGYFQLKAAPGAFDLQLAPGRSRQLYTVDESTAGVAAQVHRPIDMHSCPVFDCKHRHVSLMYQCSFLHHFG